MGSIINYIKDSFSELRDHVTWTPLIELQSKTLVVLVFSVIFALIISMLNFYLLFNLFNKKTLIKDHKEDFYLLVLAIVFIFLICSPSFSSFSKILAKYKYDFASFGLKTIFL